MFIMPFFSELQLNDPEDIKAIIDALQIKSQTITNYQFFILSIGVVVSTYLMTVMREKIISKNTDLLALKIGDIIIWIFIIIPILINICFFWLPITPEYKTWGWILQIGIVSATILMFIMHGIEWTRKWFWDNKKDSSKCVVKN